MYIEARDIDSQGIEKIRSQIIVVDDCWHLPGRWSDCERYRHRVVAICIQGRRTTVPLHRLMYIYFRGQIAPGLVVRHRCGFGGCGNPDHLTAGTQADNNRDMEFHRRHGRGVLAPERYD